MERSNVSKNLGRLFLLAWLPILCFGQSVARSTAGNSTPQARVSDYVYASLDAERSIVIYRIDSTLGSLALVKKMVLDGDPGSLAVDPTRQFLYAAIRSANSISSFRINGRTGDLTLINTIHAAGNPVFVGTDKTGRFLLTAYFADSKVAIYSVRKEGGLLDSAVQVLTTATNAHAIVSDPTNQFVFVPCRTGETIHQFRFNPVNGMLTPNTVDRMLTPAKTGPRHIVFHPLLKTAYVANELGSTVTAYHLGQEGTLSDLQTLSSLPADFVGANTGADVHVTPDGRFLYASNRGHESIAAFAVDAATGRLTSIGFFPTEKTPRSFSLDPGGRFLYAGDQGSARIAAYRIDQRNGRLDFLTSYDAGKNPVWILAARINQKQ